ncbi:uncharacterized protein LOC115750494 [Rhodamnia argentea]|uniref:Uncharacterized protein LOC115750494 n=1 Tax=Rhodamnia argentea TaxID=178133 RepID=A0A8B8Q9D6_9MYRT|nr:uncharacterized protein LOC115750494 [Rhodamnia argentea]
MGGCATKARVSKTEAADKQANEPPPEAKKAVMVVMEAGRDYSERLKEIVSDDGVNDKGDEHGIHKGRSLSLLFGEIKEAKKEVTVEAGDYSERVKEIVSDDDDNEEVDRHGTHKRRSLSALFEEVKEAKKEVLVMVEAGEYGERVKEIIADDDVTDKINEHGTHKRRSLSLLFEEVTEAKKEVTVEAGDYSNRVKEIVGDDDADANDKFDRNGTHARPSLSVIFEEVKEAKEEVMAMVEAGEYGERVKEIIGDDDVADKIDEHGTHKRRSLSLLFEEECKDSAVEDKASAELEKQGKQSCKGDIPNNNLASEPKRIGKSEVTVEEEQLAFTAGDAAREGSDGTQKGDGATPELVRKLKQMEKIQGKKPMRRWK